MSWHNKFNWFMISHVQPVFIKLKTKKTFWNELISFNFYASSSNILVIFKIKTSFAADITESLFRFLELKCTALLRHARMVSLHFILFLFYSIPQMPEWCIEIWEDYICTVDLLQEAFNVITRYELPVDREDLEQVIRTFQYRVL